MNMRYEVIAEKFFRGVYGGDSSVVDDLAAGDIISSYPIFMKIFNAPSLQGREAVKNFATGFGERWTDTQVTIHETIAEGDRVVLIWSFKARSIASVTHDNIESNEEQSWGGISFFRFNESGKITAEIGEESEPGPFGRLPARNDTS